MRRLSALPDGDKVVAEALK